MERGAATVEHAGLSLLIAIAAAVGIAAFASGPADAGRELGLAIARKLRCGAVGPGPCWRDPLTEAYGRSLAGAVRGLAPPPQALPAEPGGAALLPVDFRGCRSASCAGPSARPGLTASNRKVTVFSEAVRTAAGARIAYWEYRPGLGWRAIRREVSAAEIEALAPTPLLEEQVPALVPLETMSGANHFRFAADEEPPWRWRIERR